MHVPARPGVIIRAPEREKSKEKKMDSSQGSGISQQVADKVAASSKNQIQFVVYTNSGVCPYSDDLVSLADKRGHNFKRIDVSQSRPPPWLPGTPSVVVSGDVYCGDAAFSFVDGLQNDVEEPLQEPPEEKIPITKGKVKDESVGCGISQAFAPPKRISVDESQFNVSTEDMMQKLLAGRR